MKMFFADIAKVDELDDGTLMVHGTASSGVRDDAGEIIVPEAMKAAIPGYMAIGGTGALREMHQPLAAGSVPEAVVGDDGVTRIAAHVVDSEAIKKVRTKTYKGFSVGGKVLARDPKDPTVITGIKLVEISLVDRPCNPEATISMWKADAADTEGTDMADVASPSNEDVKARAAALAKAAGKPGRANDFLVKAREELVRALVNAEMDAELSAILKANHPALADAAVAAAIDDILTKYAEGADGTPADLAKAWAPAADTSDADTGAPDMDQALADAVAKAKDGDKPKGDYGDVDYADPGFQEDGKPRYPIDTAEHIRAAWTYINKAKNAEKYTADQVAKIKAKIEAAWKDKIDKDGPPSAEKALTAADLAKSLYDVGRVASILQELGWVADCLRYERAIEGDASTAPEGLEMIMASLVNWLKALLDEEAGELLQDGADVGPVYDEAVILAAPSAALGRLDALADFAEKAEALKPLADLLAKAGARNSKADQAHMQAAHDHLAKLGAVCDKDNCAKDDMAMAASADDLAKVAAERDRLAAAISEALPAIESLTKARDETRTELQQVKASIPGLIDEAVTKAMARPAPAKTAASSHARGITKAEDANPDDHNPDQPSGDDVAKWLDGLSPEDRAMELMRAAMKQPQLVRG
jgi:hypothetical protein